MIWQAIGGFLASLTAKLAAFLAAFKLGQTTERSKALEKEIERGKRELDRASEAKRNEAAMRQSSDAELDSGLRKYARRPKP